MHKIFRACDDEFTALSTAANTHGKESEQFKAAACKLALCQERRTKEFNIMEACCGPPQEEYKRCTQRDKGTSAHDCLPFLHSYLDCAEKALLQEAQVQRQQATR